MPPVPQPTGRNAKPRVVIIGAGFGGLAVARGLAHSGATVTIVDRQNHHVFQPLLYQVATAGLSPADIAAPCASPDWLGKFSPKQKIRASGLWQGQHLSGLPLSYGDLHKVQEFADAAPKLRYV
jgi:glycine/D-amino acid oxidase-like deaminating enzyme